MYYAIIVHDFLDWRYRGDYIVKHGVSPELADEAFCDPNRLVLDPDPASRSGKTVRVIGWCRSVQRHVTVIALPAAEATYGVNAWFSNSTDQRHYRE